MSTGDSIGDRVLGVARVWADALTYALAVTAVAAIGALLLGFATGGGFVRMKVVLFVVGWLLLAYATVRLWPSSPEDVEPEPGARAGESVPKPDSSTRFQRLVHTLPPVRWIRLPAPDERMTVPGKLLLGSLMILLLSFMMETYFGVG